MQPLKMGENLPQDFGMNIPKMFELPPPSQIRTNFMVEMRDSLPETNSKFAPENRPGPEKETIVFQPSIFRGENVSFREGIDEFRAYWRKNISNTLRLIHGNCPLLRSQEGSPYSILQ